MDDLERHALPGLQVPRVVHLGESAATQKPPDLVLAKEGVLMMKMLLMTLLLLLFDLWHQILLPEIEPPPGGSIQMNSQTGRAGPLNKNRIDLLAQTQAEMRNLSGRVLLLMTRQDV